MEGVWWVLKDGSDLQENFQKHQSIINSSGPTGSHPTAEHTLKCLTESQVLQTRALPTNRNKEAVWAHLMLLSCLLDHLSSLTHSHHSLYFCLGAKMLICGLSSYSILALSQTFLTTVATYTMNCVVHKGCADLCQISWHQH